MKWITADFLFDGQQILTRHALQVAGDGRILDVSDQVPEEAVYFRGMLSPGFINCHGHLELSGEKGRIPEKTGLPGFVRSLQQARRVPDQQAMHEGQDEMWETGTVAALDISNSADSIEIKQSSPIRFHTFVELFGFSPEVAGSVMSRGKEIVQLFKGKGLPASLTPHAPYSVSRKLVEQIFQNGEQFYSIHNQESVHESAFLLRREGAFAEMLRGFGIDPGLASWQGAENPELISAVNAHKRIVLLVHNTFTRQEDLERCIERSDPFVWCMCPRANLFIEQQLPDLPMFFAKGVPVVFGTDSLASNHNLDLFQEIHIALQNFPDLPVVELLKSLTSLPATLFGFKELGFFKRNTQPGIVHIDFDGALSNIVNGVAKKVF